MDEDLTSGQTPPEIADVEAIHNIDTARMALRWALERLQKVEREKRELTDKLDRTDKTLAKAVEERSSLQKTLSLRSSESDERELYYARLEEFLSLRLEGKLDPGALAQRELEVNQLRAVLEQKLAHSEKDLAGRRAALEREHRALREETERAARERGASLDQNYEVRKRSLEQDHLSRLSELREKEILLRQEEKALNERQAHFEEYYSSQRAQLHTQIKTYREEIESQVRFRVQLAEKVLEERQASVEAGWTGERLLLVRELDLWKQKVLKLAPRVNELEQSLAAADEAARQIRSSADAKILVFEEQRRGFEVSLSLESRRFAELKAAFEKDRAALMGQIEQWRQRAEQHLASNHDLSKRLAENEEKAQQWRAAAERELSLMELRRQESKSQQDALAGEVESAKARYQDGLSKIFGLEKRLAAADAALEEARVAANVHEEHAQARRRAAEQTQQAMLSELESSRQRVQEMVPRLLELERAVSAAEDARASEDKRLQRFEAQRKIWETEQAALLDELGHWRAKASQALPRILELERDLAETKEALVRLPVKNAAPPRL